MKPIASIFFFFLLLSQAKAQLLRPVDQAAAARGEKYLFSMVDAMSFFTTSELAEIWRTWEPNAKANAERLTPAERKKLIFQRYGFLDNPRDPGTPLGFVRDTKGGHHISCLLCHANVVNGAVYLGAPNTNLDLATFMQDRGLQNPIFLAMAPWISHSKGTVNTSNLGAFELEFRDLNMNRTLIPNGLIDVTNSGDLDIPAWWNVKKRTHHFADSSYAWNPKIFMTVILSPFASGEKVRSALPHFQDALRFVDTVEAPKYKGTINRELARSGRVVFENTCAKCHGTEAGIYPNKVVPLSVVNTDSVRALDPLNKRLRGFINKSWLGDYGSGGTVLNPGGYNAPPLDGIWASAPYLHNGSVPTLYHLLHSAERPTVWKRTGGYDHQKMGLAVEELTAVPANLVGVAGRRYFNTRIVSKSNRGHTFPDKLTEEEKIAVLEYLKTR